MIKFFVTLVVILSMSSCRLSEVSPQLVIKTKQGSQVVDVEIASDANQRARGLMGRTNLADNQGMLFVWPYEVKASFWMKDTPLSLDIIFLDSHKKVVHIEPSTTPYSEKLITSPKKFRYVLEVKSGFAKKIGLQQGDRVE